MFYQNSNDLVKNASLKSGHVQNSRETQQHMISQLGSHTPVIQVNGVSSELGANNNNMEPGAGAGDQSSLNIGMKFQQFLKDMVNIVSLKEGLNTTRANPVQNKSMETSMINRVVAEDKEYTKQSIEHTEKVSAIMELIDKQNSSTRQKWVEVTDMEGVSKYGYITKDGIFQIWHAPSSPSANPTNWFETDKMKQNTTLTLGCPAASSSIEKLKIAGKWNEIKPYSLVYSDTDTSRTNPLFMLINDMVRDPNNSFGRKGLFSCGNERGNVIVTERPSADFQFPSSNVDTLEMGCYVMADNVGDAELTNRGFKFQEDLREASISQCKRRTEDLGRTYFLLSAPDKGKPNNRGGCWVYMQTGKPNINGLLTMSSDETKCHNVANKQDDEDEFLKQYSSTTLKRLYGINHIGSSNTFVAKRHGMWGGEAPNEYTCKGAKGRNITGNWGDFERYCIFDKEEDAVNWCASDPTCLGYVNNRPNMYQVTRKPIVNPYGGTYFEKNSKAKSTKSVGLYSLKSGGTTGVDITNPDKLGHIGTIAYIDHNGERHKYPSSALSFRTPTKENPGDYVNIGAYDTRSAESSYSLKEITPPTNSDAVNLLYKATRDGWGTEKFHQRCDNKGPTYTRILIKGGKELCGYTSVSWASIPHGVYVNDETAFLYDGEHKYPSTNEPEGPGKYAVFHRDVDYPLFGRGNDGRGNDLYIAGNGPNPTLYMSARTYQLSNGRAPLKKRIQMAKMYGPWITSENYAIDTEVFFLENGGYVYAFNDTNYTKMVSNSNEEKYLPGNKLSDFDPKKWNTYYRTGGGKYLLKYINEFKEYPRKAFQADDALSVEDIEVYSVDANTFPKTNPPDYAVRLRTMPVGETVTASFEKCREMCDADNKCGGFVYTKSSGGAPGKCDLKDRTKMYPFGLRVADPTKQLMLKVPSINETIGDNTCKANNGTYTPIHSAQYAHYPDTGSMTANTKCNMRDLIPKTGDLKPTNMSFMFGAVDSGFDSLEENANEFSKQTAVPPSANKTTEGMTTNREPTYGEVMTDVQNNLNKITKAESQRERLNAMAEESNKTLISESYKFILWSILAILTVLALLKLKEMFGQDDAEEGGGGEGGGILATILGWFSLKSLKLDDIPDNTENMKAAFSSVGEQMKQATANLTTGITEGADNLVNSANEAASSAMEGATNLVDKAKETASNAIDQVGTATAAPPAAPPAAPSTGGRKSSASASSLKTKKK